MFEGKGTLLVCMALYAGDVGSCCEAGLFLLEPSVRIVTIATVYRTFQYLVMKWQCVLGLSLVMALHTELNFVPCQQVLRREVIRLCSKRSDGHEG